MMTSENQSEKKELNKTASKLVNSRIIWFAISTAILLALFYFADYQKVIAVLYRSSLYYVALSVFSGLFTLFVWIFVWQRFFDMLDIQIKIRETSKLLLSGQFLNAVTPLGRFGGEPLVAYLVSNETDATFQQALSSVSSADLSNAIPFATFGLVSFTFVFFFETFEAVSVNLFVLMVSMVFLAAFLIYMAWFNGAKTLIELVKRFYIFEIKYGRWEPYIESGKERGREILERLEMVGKQPKKVFWALSLSHLAVVGHVAATYFALLAVGVEPVLSTVVLLVSLSAILTFSPTPGSTGALEAGFVFLILTFYDTSAATATSATIIYRVATYLPGVILGYVSLLILREH